MKTYQPFTHAERPELAAQANAVQASAWDEFMLNDSVANRHWRSLTTQFAEYQFMLLDEQDEIVAGGNSIPVFWDGNPNSLPAGGWDAMFMRGIEGREKGQIPNTLCALSIGIAPARRSQGISAPMVQTMKHLAEQSGFTALIAPVRPSQKRLYPLTPIERYIQWTQPDGAPFDAWIRTHWRLGAKIISPCPQSMTIEGTIAEWEAWTNMRFPETGMYIVPGALVPVEIHCEQNIGRYVEPNVWMLHPIERKP